MTDLVYDLVLFARWMLVPGGRLVFFLPTVTEDWDDLDVPIVQGMKEIKFCSGSSQDFGRWSRRVSLELS
jgi:tRNA (guanine10-N2)-methyltransferase